MKISLEALRRRHAEIDSAVREESKRIAPDSVAIRVLKKLRLRLKDQIEALTRRVGSRTSLASPPSMAGRALSGNAGLSH